MRKIFTFSAILAALFACNKEQSAGDSANETATKNVTISISQQTPTKGVEDQIVDGEYAVIGSATIFFLNSSGDYILQRDLTADEVTSVANTPSTNGGKTIEIDGVPNSATSLQFIANIKTSAHPNYPAIEGSSIDDTRLRIDMMQNNSQYTPMSGISSNFIEDIANEGYYTTKVVLTPMVARIEVGAVEYDQDDATQSDLDITGYKLAGVYINNIRPYISTKGTPYASQAAVNITSQPNWESDGNSFFDATNVAFPYVTGESTTPSDWTASSLVTHCTPTGDNALTFYPDGTNGSTSTTENTLAWAYNVAPSSEVTGDAIATDIPHVIIKLSDVTYRNRPYGNTEQYVTVTNFNDASGNPIQQFKKGNVYRIENLKFGYQESTDKPYEDNIIVTVTVTVEPWIINTVSPSWN